MAESNLTKPDPIRTSAPASACDSLLRHVRDNVSVVDLSHTLSSAIPHSPNAPDFSLALSRRHGDVQLEGGGSFAAEIIVTGGHTGTHVDALSHVSVDGYLYGGVDARDAQRGGLLSSHGIEQMKPVVARGVLLDVADLHGVPVLPAGYGITRSDLVGAAQRASVEVRQGDVVLIRSGWGAYIDETERFVGIAQGVPGPTADAARWLAEQGVRATGAETIAYEQIRPYVGHASLPVHHVLLVEYGIHIIEVMKLDDLAETGVHEFLIVVAPLKILGATGSPVRPLAILDVPSAPWL